MGLTRGVLCRRCWCWQLRGHPALPRGSAAQRGGVGHLLPPSGRCLFLPMPPARFYSSGNGDSKSEVRAVFFGFPNPLRWLRTRLYFFLIRTYFDRDFSVQEFMQGAKHVSRWVEPPRRTSGCYMLKGAAFCPPPLKTPLRGSFGVRLATAA